MKRFKYDYYTIELPSDLIEVYRKDWEDQMIAFAVEQAREQARLWCVPCEWSACLIAGGPDEYYSTFKVRRRRVNSQPASGVVSQETTK